MKYKDIASKYDVALSTVKSWKTRKWNDTPKVATNKKSTRTKKEKVAYKKDAPKAVVELVETDELTEQQKTFCLLLLKYKYNQTKAYREAFVCSYDTARTNASRLLAKANVNKYVMALKLELRSNSFVDIQDIIAEYENQLSADITDYVKFGKREIEMTGMFGPIKDDKGNVIMKEVNYVDFNESAQLDGTLIKNVRMGKDGPVVELYDKQKAMEALVKLKPDGNDGGGNITIVNAWGDDNE